jgi:hypothetical protein
MAEALAVVEEDLVEAITTTVHLVAVITITITAVEQHLFGLAILFARDLGFPNYSFDNFRCCISCVLIIVVIIMIGLIAGLAPKHTSVDAPLTAFETKLINPSTSWYSGILGKDVSYY